MMKLIKTKIIKDDPNYLLRSWLYVCVEVELVGMRSGGLRYPE